MTDREMVVDMRVLIDDIREKVNHGQSVRLKGDGVSMRPFITDKDLLTLNKPKRKKAKIGEIYLYKRENGSYAIHRVYAVKKERVYMLGDAQLLLEKVPESALVAIVSSVERPNEIIDCTALSVRARGAVRMKMRIAKAKCRWAFRSLLGKMAHLLDKIKTLIK